MKPFLIDVPVLLIFFKRDETFRKVFDVVKQVRPNTVLLWQDGAREGNQDDVAGIERCRKIAEEIDWDCKVYKQYNTKNFGCDPSTFLSHKWAFSYVDRCIILEDDLVPDPSFFPFCKELLDKYENDTRISHICGMNLVDCSDFEYDYFFYYFGTNTWATWKRVFDQWEEDYGFLKDKETLANLKRKMGEPFVRAYNNAIRRSSTGKPYWESLLGFSCMLHNQYAIISTRNLSSNIGATADATHAQINLNYLTDEEKGIYAMKTTPVSMPLRHPKYVVPDYRFKDRMDSLTCKGYPFKKLYRKVRLAWMYLIHGELLAKLRKKLK